MHKRIVAAAVALAAMTGSALAADIFVPPVAPPAPTAVPVFSWAGSYAGVYGGVYFPFAWQAGVTVGHNFVSGSLIYGIEAQAAIASNPMLTNFTADLTARVGAAVGSADRALVYVEGGVGTVFTVGPYLSIGGGVEFAVTDSLSVFAEAKAIAAVGLGPQLFDVFGFTAGVNWHFGHD